MLISNDLHREHFLISVTPVGDAGRHSRAGSRRKLHARKDNVDHRAPVLAADLIGDIEIIIEGTRRN